MSVWEEQLHGDYYLFYIYLLYYVNCRLKQSYKCMMLAVFSATKAVARKAWKIQAW